MCRVHPDHDESKWGPIRPLASRKLNDGYRSDVPLRFTVWKKSSMSFQGTDGFTVFDHLGGLVFRVDNYSRNKHLFDGVGIVLMDGVGNALLALRPQGFSMQCQWNAYRGGKSSPEYRVFAMRRRMRSLLPQNTKDDQVDIFLEGSPRSNRSPEFRVEGSFGRRNCVIRRNEDGALVAKIARKRANAAPMVVLGDDVFSLVVQPGFNSELVMGFVLVLDRICRKPYSPVLCS